MVLRAERGGIGFVSDSAATGSLFIINVQTRSEAEAFRLATLSQKLPYSASRHVRFTPKSGHSSAPSRCPLCAISEHI